MKIFGIYSKVELIHKPKWLDDFRKIYDKLNKGIAIIACQKNKDAELPKGGSGLLEKARMAVSLDPGTIKLTIAKNWADGISISPRGKTWSYKLLGGINIINPQESFDTDT